MSSWGTQTSALAAGGNDPSLVNSTETWNGSSWTEVNNLNTTSGEMGGAGPSTSDGLAFGGSPYSPTTQTRTEIWDGTNWTEANDLSTGKAAAGSAGTPVSAIYAGGEAPPKVATSETWTGGLANKTISAS